MRIITILFIISLTFSSACLSQTQDWQWTISAKPDIDAGLFDICMLTDCKTGWATGHSREFVGGKYIKMGRVFYTTDGWSTWEEQTDTNVTKSNFRDVCFVDKLNGWIVGEDGLILHTSNGGINWEIQGAEITFEDLVGVSALDANNAWAIGSNGTIIYTNDGSNWSLINTTTTEVFLGIDMFDVHHGITVGKHETIFYTTDGVNWTPASSVPKIGSKDFNAVCMLDQNTAWLVGDGFNVLSLKSVFAKTTDGGNTWTLWEPTEMIMENMWAIDFTCPTKGVAVGDNGWVFVTSDGNDWTPLQRHFGSSSEDIAIAGDKIWISGSGGTIQYSQDFGANWSLLPQITGNYLYKIAIADNNRIIAIGYASSILKTEDGGLKWRSGSVVADNEVAQQLWGIDFATSDIGWVAGTVGFIAKTTNGGKSWSLQGVDVTMEWLRHIWAYDQNVVWIVGNKGIILKTENSGIDWTVQGYGVTSNNLNSIEGLDQNRLVAVGEKSTFLFTTDGGLNWHFATHDLEGEKRINGMDVVDENHAWAVGSDGLILFSSDDGKNWKNQNSPTTVDLDGVRFKDASTGWIVGDSGTIFETTDGGKSWTQMAVGLTNEYLKSVVITEDGKVFACGYSGIITRYGPTSIGSVETDESNNVITQFKLNQNYPNPFNLTTNINYEIPSICHVKIVIYNVVGQKIMTLVNETNSPGSYQITWDANNRPGGVYFVKMITKEFSATRKLLLLK